MLRRGPVVEFSRRGANLGKNRLKVGPNRLKLARMGKKNGENWLIGHVHRGTARGGREN